MQQHSSAATGRISISSPIELCSLRHSDFLEWMQEFRENFVEDRVPERRDSHASSSHEPSLEPTQET